MRPVEVYGFETPGVERLGRFGIIEAGGEPMEGPDGSPMLFDTYDDAWACFKER